jgi:hypothetical protein
MMSSSLLRQSQKQ